MTPTFSMTAPPPKAILRASVVLVLLPLALGFAPAISTVRLSASSGNRRALTASSISPSLPRVTAGPLAVTMLTWDSLPLRRQVHAVQREHASRRATTVLRTAVATIAAVFMLGSARPASALDNGGARTLLAGDAPAMVSAGLTAEAKVDERIAAPKQFKKMTRGELMAKNVKTMHRTNFGNTPKHRFKMFCVRTMIFGSSLLVLPWKYLGRRAEMAQAGVSRLTFKHRSKSMYRSKNLGL
ncbi:hypothetical protein T484DRAFT_1842916 [Baffinella frigidus]|nr:hypothetical protein T484DRAFT_1842916 [Cryptophyta sp. CCMP2293]